MRHLFTSLLFLTALTTQAQHKTILTNTTVIDGTGRAPQSHVAVVISDGKIIAVTRGKLAVSPDDVQIDCTGKFIMPEIIDCHSHVGNLKGTSTSPENYTSENVRRQLAKFQDYGIAAVLSMGTEQPLGIALRDSSKAGQVPGTTFYSAIYGFGVKNAMPPAGIGARIYRPETPAEAIKNVKELATFRPDVVKMWVDDFYGQFKKDQIMKPEIYAAIIKEAHKHNIRVAAHLYHLSDARRLVANGINMMAHSIRDAEVDSSLITEMKKKKVGYIPTLSLDEFAYAYEDSPSWLNDPFFRNSIEPGVYEMITSAAYKEKVSKNPVTAQEKTALKIALKNAARLYRAGILVALGTDAGANPLRAQGFAEHLEMELLVQAGLTPLQVISIATANGARLLQIDSTQGTLQTGKKANFIILDKNPLDDIRNTRTISSVWNNGVKVSDGPVAH
ncbi:MAG: amidohydrolase family protein [Bacteroidetes bacterium]|nr:amidohydrolase family protein [Bacteroidota bacterium]